MEKKEEIREYCIDKALEIYQTTGCTAAMDAQSVIEAAKEIEEYITDIPCPKNTKQGL